MVVKARLLKPVNILHEEAAPIADEDKAYATPPPADEDKAYVMLTTDEDKAYTTPITDEEKAYATPTADEDKAYNAVILIPWFFFSSRDRQAYKIGSTLKGFYK